MRRPFLLLPVLAAVAAGCGTTSSATNFSGADQGVAEQVEALQAAAEARDGDEVCGELLSDRLRAAMRADGASCADQVEEAIADADDFELEVERVDVQGDNATVRVLARVDGSQRPRELAARAPARRLAHRLAGLSRRPFSSRAPRRLPGRGPARQTLRPGRRPRAGPAGRARDGRRLAGDHRPGPRMVVGVDGRGPQRHGGDAPRPPRRGTRAAQPLDVVDRRDRLLARRPGGLGPLRDHGHAGLPAPRRRRLVGLRGAGRGRPSAHPGALAQRAGGGARRGAAADRRRDGAHLRPAVGRRGRLGAPAVRPRVGARLPLRLRVGRRHHAAGHGRRLAAPRARRGAAGRAGRHRRPVRRLRPVVRRAAGGRRLPHHPGGPAVGRRAAGHRRRRRARRTPAGDGGGSRRGRARGARRPAPRRGLRAAHRRARVGRVRRAAAGRAAHAGRGPPDLRRDADRAQRAARAPAARPARPRAPGQDRARRPRGRARGAQRAAPPAMSATTR